MESENAPKAADSPPASKTRHIPADDAPRAFAGKPTRRKDPNLERAPHPHPQADGARRAAAAIVLRHHPAAFGAMLLERASPPPLPNLQ
ncbi:MAG: hypothetical protein KH142_09320 [Slackia piriformis]|uniref:Uncharacterized protein n=1 Tax=Slackia piriformis TaxID=626934 RepID=A0A943YZ35_9ACTN|nr:hypothetical protein [Slackia piriformis]